MRDQTTVLQRSARMLKGLYNADVNLLVIVAGMFGQLGERPLGLVQVYAAQGTAATPEEAIGRGSEAFTALLTNLRTIPQSRFVPMAEEERDFVRDHLGPALAAAGLAYVLIPDEAMPECFAADIRPQLRPGAQSILRAFDPLPNPTPARGRE